MIDVRRHNKYDNYKMMITNKINMLGVGMLRKKVLVNSSTFFFVMGYLFLCNTSLHNIFTVNQLINNVVDKK